AAMADEIRRKASSPHVLASPGSAQAFKNSVLVTVYSTNASNVHEILKMSDRKQFRRNAGASHSDEIGHRKLLSVIHFVCTILCPWERKRKHAANRPRKRFWRVPNFEANRTNLC